MAAHVLDIVFPRSASPAVAATAAFVAAVVLALFVVAAALVPFLFVAVAVLLLGGLGLHFTYYFASVQHHEGVTGA